jgi:hypothetical protein
MRKKTLFRAPVCLIFEYLLSCACYFSYTYTSWLHHSKISMPKSKGNMFKKIETSMKVFLNFLTNTRRKIEMNDSINDSFLSRLGHKLLVKDSINVFGFESLWMSHLGHLSRLCTRGYISSKG